MRRLNVTRRLFASHRVSGSMDTGEDGTGHRGSRRGAGVEPGGGGPQQDPETDLYAAARSVATPDRRNPCRQPDQPDPRGRSLTAVLLETVNRWVCDRLEWHAQRVNRGMGQVLHSSFRAINDTMARR